MKKTKAGKKFRKFVKDDKPWKGSPRRKRKKTKYAKATVTTNEVHGAPFVPPPSWNSIKHLIETKAPVAAPTKKERSVAYVRLSMEAKKAHVSRQHTLNELNKELGLVLTPEHLNEVVAMGICVDRLEEVLQVLETAP